MFGTISTALPPSGENQFRKISQKLEPGLYMSGLEGVTSKKWGVGRPTVITYIHRLSSPGCMGDPMVGGKGGRWGSEGEGLRAMGNSGLVGVHHGGWR